VAILHALSEKSYRKRKERKKKQAPLARLAEELAKERETIRNCCSIARLRTKKARIRRGRITVQLHPAIFFPQETSKEGKRREPSGHYRKQVSIDGEGKHGKGGKAIPNFHPRKGLGQRCCWREDGNR